MAAVGHVIIDLSQPADKLPINGTSGDGFRNAKVATVVVLSVPDNSGVLLHFGSDAQGWEILPTGTEYELCPPENTGIFYTLANPPGGQLILGVSFDEGQVSA